MFNEHPIRLEGKWIRLELLQQQHHEALEQIARDERIWSFTSYKPIGSGFERWFNKALTSYQQQHHYPFVVYRKSDQRIIGSTRLYDISEEHKRLILGYTWYVPEVWGSAINPECKYLLLNYIFETLQFNRIEFAVDARNLRSRAAVKKLGAIEEGILRQHMILDDGVIRDTVIFSIIKPEWSAVKINLQKRIEI